MAHFCLKTTSTIFIYLLIVLYFVLYPGCDMTPLDFFLWGTVKEMVYNTPINSVDHLEEKITEAIRAITPETLMRVKTFFWNRIDACERNMD